MGCIFEGLYYFLVEAFVVVRQKGFDGAGGVTLKQGLYFGGRIFVFRRRLFAGAGSELQASCIEPWNRITAAIGLF